MHVQRGRLLQARLLAAWVPFLQVLSPPAAHQLIERVMVKQRMTSADVAGEVACLKQRLLGLRLANVYDINAKVCCSGHHHAIH